MTDGIRTPSFTVPGTFISSAMCHTHLHSSQAIFFSLRISILTLEKYTTKIYKTLIKCWYSWFQHSQSQWPSMESKQQLAITMSKACIHCVLRFIVWHANIVSISFTLGPKYKESQPKSSVSFTQKNKVQSCLISCKLLVITTSVVTAAENGQEDVQNAAKAWIKRKNLNKFEWWCIVWLTLASFGGPEMPYWMQNEVPQMEAGLVWSVRLSALRTMMWSLLNWMQIILTSQNYDSFFI